LLPTGNFWEHTLHDENPLPTV
jgi:hypothetical protein